MEKHYEFEVDQLIGGWRVRYFINGDESYHRDYTITRWGAKIEAKRWIKNQIRYSGNRGVKVDRYSYPPLKKVK